MTTKRILEILTAAALTAAVTPAVASASTWTVDDDRAQCPNAGFTTIQAAINQAAPHDTIKICDGLYAEGTASIVSSTFSPVQTGAKAGLLITKPLDLIGAGASKVTIRPAASLGATLAGSAPYLRDGGGAVIQINRQSLGSSDFTENFVTISGVTVDSPSTYAEAGVSFFNTSGKITKSKIGPLLRPTDPSTQPHGWGVVMTNSLQGASEATVRREVTIEDSLITGYAAGGVLFDAARGVDGNATTTQRSGIIQYGFITGSRIVGSGPDTLIPQTGVQWHAGARGSITGSEVSANSYTPDPRKSVGLLLTDATTGPDPGNPSVPGWSASGVSLTGNGYGLFNADIANTGVRLGAPAGISGSFFGCAAGPVFGAPSDTATGCQGLSGPDSASAPSVTVTSPLTTAPAGLSVPGAVTDAPPTAAFVDPAPGASAPYDQALTPTIQVADDFGIKSVALSVDGAPLQTKTSGPYEFSWTPGPAAIGAPHTLSAVITDSSGQQVTRTLSVTTPVPAGYKAATLSPTSWDAAIVDVPGNASRIFTLTNSGVNPVTVGTPALGGSAQFSLLSGTTACTPNQVLAVGASCTIEVRFTPTGGAAAGTLTVPYTAIAGTGPLTATLTGTGRIVDTESATVSGTVAQTLALSLANTAPSLGTFLPGVAGDYTAGVTLGVTTSGGSSALTVLDPSSDRTGKLVQGPFALASPLQAKATNTANPTGAYAPVGSTASPTTLLTYPAPVSNDAVTATFKQTISATEPLRTGSYAKTVLFTLSTTTP